MRRPAAALLAIAAATIVAGCGSEDHPNNQRPASPVQLSARINDGKVVIAPDKVGAGLATVTISNQSRDDVALNFTGPNEATTGSIPAGGVSSLKFDLEQGDYKVDSDVATISSGNLRVGAPRPSAQNDLLLP